MRYRSLASGALAGVFALLWLASVPMNGQAPGAAKPTGVARTVATLRTAWGDPDLQGIWHVIANVPLERAAEYAGREFLTDAEVAALDQKKAVDPGRNSRGDDGARDVGGAYNAVFNSILKTGKRTSLITDPKDGRIPSLTEDAQKRQAAQGGRGGRGGQAAQAGQGGRGAQPLRYDNPEDIGSTRCLGVQMPFLPLNTAFAQGTVMRVVQSPKSVGIYLEDDHAGGGNRIIPVDGSPHVAPHIRPYLGDSRGHWEGNTLVVETTNFQPQRAFRGANADTFRMIERFTRVDAKNLRREITFEDPRTWTRPWTVLIEMGRSDDKLNLIFDSTCHEGNYGMTGILVGARALEKAEAAKQGPAR